MLRKLPWLAQTPQSNPLSTLGIDERSSEEQVIHFQIVNHEYSDQSLASITRNETLEKVSRTQALPDDENLPVDANFYFFLIVCEHPDQILHGSRDEADNSWTT